MKRILSVICLAICVQFSIAQKFIEYNGFNYYEKVLSIKDSLITFYPVDEAKLAAVGGVSSGNIEIPVSNPNYQKDHYSFTKGLAIYPTITIKNVEVEDTAANQRKVDEKRKYAEYRLKVVQAVKEQMEAIKAQKGEKLTDEKQIFVYTDMMNRHSWDDKDIAKLKVGKNCMYAISIHIKELDSEEANLLYFLGLTDKKQILSTNIARDGYTGDGQKMGSALGLPSTILRHDNTAYNYANYTEQLSTKKINLTIKNPLLADKPMTVLNPWYEGPGAEEWQWLEDLGKKGELQHVVTSFPKEEDYYKSDKYPNYRFHYDDNNYPYAIDLDGNLIAVSRYTNHNGSMDAATMLYDYEHNVYDIKSESNGVQKWALYLINKKLGIDIMPQYEKDAMGMMLGVGGIAYQIENLHRLYAYRKITKAEYDRKLAELNSKAKTLGKKADAIAKKYPSKEEMDRAEKYVEQLERDYYNDKLFKKTHIERLNGIQFLLITDDRKVKVLETFSIDAKGELKTSLVTLEKNKD